MDFVEYRRHKIYPYMVGSNGTVFDLNLGTFKEPTKRPDGYVSIRVKAFKTQRKNMLLHRLVAETFFGESNLQVNHKNKIKSDNSIQNLEYVTPRGNMTHAHKSETKKYVYRSHPTSDKWKIVIKLGGGKTFRSVERFRNKEEAYVTARELYFNFFGEYPWSNS